MSEFQEHHLKELAQLKTYPNLRFEPGDHGVNLDTSVISQPEMMSRYNRFLAGDPDAHPWNQALVARVEATKPKLVAIDGLGFSETSDRKGLPRSTPAFSDATWIGLPTTPEKMNPEDKSVFVVNGDDASIGEPFDYPLMEGPDMQALRNALNTRVDKDYNNASRDDFMEVYAALAAAGLIDIAMGGDIAWHKFKQKETVISRRNFLKLGAGVVASAAAFKYGEGRIDSIRDAAFAPTEEEKDEWLARVALFQPKIIKSKQTDMRTALLILKTKDAIDQLNLPKDVSSSVIMGDAHSFGAEEFLENDRLAQDAILDYVNSLDPVLTQALNNNPAISRQQALDAIKGHLAQTFVQKVDQPDPATYGTTEFPNSVKQATTLVAEFKSDRVEAALANLH